MTFFTFKKKGNKKLEPYGNNKCCPKEISSTEKIAKLKTIFLEINLPKTDNSVYPTNEQMLACIQEKVGIPITDVDTIQIIDLYTLLKLNGKLTYENLQDVGLTLTLGTNEDIMNAAQGIETYLTDGLFNTNDPNATTNGTIYNTMSEKIAEMIDALNLPESREKYTIIVYKLIALQSTISSLTGVSGYLGAAGPNGQFGPNWPSDTANLGSWTYFNQVISDCIEMTQNILNSIDDLLINTESGTRAIKAENFCNYMANIIILNNGSDSISDTTAKYGLLAGLLVVIYDNASLYAP